MALVTITELFPLLDTGSIPVLLSLFPAPAGGATVLEAVRLWRPTGRLHQGGVNQGAPAQDGIALFQLLYHGIKQLIQQTSFAQPLPEAPDSAEIRHVSLITYPQETLKAQTVNQSIFQRRVAKIVKILQNQAFQRKLNRYSRTTPPAGFVHRLANDLQLFPIHKLINLLQQIITAAALLTPIESTGPKRNLSLEI